MTTHTQAYLDVTVSTMTAEQLLNVLRSRSDFAADLIERYRDRWLPKAWELDSQPANGEPTLWGPGGFGIRFVGRVLQLSHIMPFGTFTSDAWSRHALREACHTIAGLVGAPRVLYTHELMPCEGEDVRAIADWLHVNIGPPAANFSELHAADYYGPRAWYLETTGDDPTITRA
jgi:hypothetical protein